MEDEKIFIKSNEIIIKNLCPMLAMISAGKTSVLKVIFDIDFLESSSGIGTKFVNIIRYNPEVGPSPKFFHLILKNKGNGNYNFYKDEKSEVIGKKEIKEKNKELNDEFKKKEVAYEELFYMVEVGEANFIDKEYLKNYDLVDIPGVSEYNKSENNENNNFINPQYLSTIEEEMKSYNPENEKNYLTEIFKIIKNKMNNGIILFSIDNYQHVENYRIIGKFQKVINKPIENFLILLNKIDKSENREGDINNLYSKITEFFPNLKEFNFTKNIIVPCSTIQLENELKMDKSFEHCIYFHYLNFLMNSKSNKNIDKISFIDFIKKILNKKKIKKKYFEKAINNIINDPNLLNILDEIKGIFKKIYNNHRDDNLNLGVREDEFEENEVKNIIENIEENEEDEFSINDQEGNSIILYYYHEFKNKKLIPQKSKDTLTIMKYFTLENKKSSINKEKENKKLIQNKGILNEEIMISEKMNQLYIKLVNEENLKEYKKYLNLPSNILNSSNLIYIPLLGASNAGKSTMLNGLIGYEILPVQKNECTKKGILIRYCDNDYPVIRKTKFIKEKNRYYFQTGKDIIATGFEDIQKILRGLNGKFTENEEDFFYEIDIRIEFIHNSQMNDSLKERICFVDLPGFGTNNKFEEQDTYSHLINICNIFLFVVFNLKIKENDNQKMINNLYNEMVKQRNISIKEFIKKFIFIINCEKDQDTSNISLKQAKNDIIGIVNNLNEENFNDLTVCFFNAKYYENYVFNYRYYNSVEFLFEHEYNEFLRLSEQLNKGLIDRIKGGTFNKFFIEKLKLNINRDIPDKFNLKTIKINKELKKEIIGIIQKNKFSFNNNEIDIILNYISFARENLCKSDLLKMSNIEIINMNLLISLMNICLNEEKSLNNKIDNISKKMFNLYEQYKNEEINKYEIDKLKLYLNSSIGILKTSKLFYIPILGVKGSGKSTILNCIIGESYLPTSEKCTKKGIIIKYWNRNYSVIRKTRFKKEKDKEMYYFQPEEEIIAKDYDDIRIILEGVNDKFTKDEEDFFYEIDIKLKFIHDLKLDSSLKEKICFIELPKNKNIFEKKTNLFNLNDNNKIKEEINNIINLKENFYYNLICSCNSFLYVFFNYKPQDNINNKNLLIFIYNQLLRYRGISVQDFLNKCLFIINDNNAGNPNSNNLIFDYTQKIVDICNILKIFDTNINIDNFSLTYFNAKFYETFLFKLKYYGSTSFFINFEYNEYLKSQKNILVKMMKTSFDKYLIKKLSKNIKIDIPNKFIEEEVILNEDILDSMKQVLGTKIISFKEKDFYLLIKYLSFGKEKIYNSNWLLKSKFVNLIKNLFTFILRTKKIEDNQIKINFKNCFEILDNSLLLKENKYIIYKEFEEEEELEDYYEEDKYNNYSHKNNNYKNIWNEINEIYDLEKYI